MLAPVFILCAAYIGALISFLLDDLITQDAKALVVALAGLIATLFQRFSEISKGLKKSKPGKNTRVIRGNFNDFVILMVIVTFLAAILALVIGQGRLFS